MAGGIRVRQLSWVIVLRCGFMDGAQLKRATFRYRNDAERVGCTMLSAIRRFSARAMTEN